MSDLAFTVKNKLLSSLLSSTYQRLSPHLEEVSFDAGEVVHQPDTKITEVYFPQSARFSLVLMMSDRSVIEIGSIGFEGIVGLCVVFGSDSTNTSSMVQIPGTALKLPAEIIKQEFQRGEELQKLLLLYTQVQLVQTSQIAACRSHHEIEQRLARWLLLIYDGIQQDTLPLTQKFISLMLGVRRASITETAISFQKQGIIQYSRGKITILNSSRLESIACECYGKIKSEYNRLLNTEIAEN
ncbi:MAG: Crp/Fnr family transcriptional regulator [Pleurocapsa sp. MO_226.B13]|nr:Crp/Fnr family transcriptional regulator [Pleurocapsa sp. MO_226.B13]